MMLEQFRRRRDQSTFPSPGISLCPRYVMPAADCGVSALSSLVLGQPLRARPAFSPLLFLRVPSCPHLAFARCCAVLRGADIRDAAPRSGEEDWCSAAIAYEVEVELLTGRTHQIRAQLSHVG